jgi:tetratricopeptide (TPR) repeat protein
MAQTHVLVIVVQRGSAHTVHRGVCEGMRDRGCASTAGYRLAALQWLSSRAAGLIAVGAWGSAVAPRLWQAGRLGLVLVATVAVAGPATGQPLPAWVRCAGGNGISADGQIGGCTLVIQSGREGSQRLAQAFSHRGTAFFTKGDYRRAIQDYSQAINLDPGNATAFDNRCWTRATLGLLGEALQDCDQSLKLRPSHAATLATRGFTLLKAGDLEAAIADFNAALAIAPQNAYALYGRGLAKLKKADAEGNDDIGAAKTISGDIALEFARYGLK